ncbi:hypothetical protein AB5J62_02090 [Amycolatopsis sp. cg5]|uniref:hypothetical protein n=1 Tax=Amycolatopsis sp. cg5 TaxID=3238802 RepID=UPI0035237B59
MAEQRGDDQPGKELQPSTPSSPQPLDEEQLRQFQQFQQFQDYLKFTEAQRQGGGVVPAQPQPSWQQGPPGEIVPAPPRKMKAPKWATWLGKKVLAWVIAIVLLGLAATWAYNHFFPSDEGKTSEQLAKEGGGTYKTNLLYSTTPYEAVWFIYNNVAQNIPKDACLRFKNGADQKFAGHMGFTDCKTAVEALHAKVTNQSDYARSMPMSVSDPITSDTLTISSCKFGGAHDGPPLGAFVVQKVNKGQWIIIDHLEEPDPCPAPSPTTGPTR